MFLHALFHPRAAILLLGLFCALAVANHYGLFDRHKVAFQAGAVVFGVSLVAGGVLWQRRARRKAAEEFERMPVEDQAYQVLVDDKRWHEALALAEEILRQDPGRERAAIAAALPLVRLGRRAEALERLDGIAGGTVDAAVRKRAKAVAQHFREEHKSQISGLFVVVAMGALCGWVAFALRSQARQFLAAIVICGGLSLTCLVALLRALGSARRDRRGNVANPAPAVDEALRRLRSSGETVLAQAVASARQSVCPSDASATPIEKAPR